MGKAFCCMAAVLALFGGCFDQNVRSGSNGVNAGINGPAPSPAATPRKKKMMNEETIKDVTMRAQAENTEDALVVTYEVENQSENMLYLWDQMIGWSGMTKVIDHDAAYVFFEEPATVRLIRADLPLPELRQIGKKEIPYARVLPPKGKLTGRIRLVHPVKEYSPYYEPLKDDEAELKRCSQVRLMIGWTPPKAGMNTQEHTVGGEKVIAIRGAWAPPYANILEQFIPVNVDLMTYTTQFERQMPLR